MRRHLKPFLIVLALLWAQTASAQTLTQLLTAVRQNIRDTATSTSLQRYSDSILTGYLNEAQRDIVNQTWCVSSSTSITLSANTTYYTLPTDVIAIQRATLSYGNLPEVEMQQLDADNNNAAWETTGSTPTYYFQDRSQKTKIGVYPFPSSSAQAGTLRLIYFAYATDLASGSDVPFNSLVRFTGYQDLLVFYATYRILGIEAIFDKAQFFQTLYETRLEAMNETFGFKPDKVPAVPQKPQKPQ